MSKRLEKTGETVIVGGNRNSGSCYHTDKECPVISQMDSPKKRDRAVAEWQNLSHCSVCDPEQQSHIGKALTAADVENARERALQGESSVVIASDTKVGPSCLRKHMRGNYEDNYPRELDPGPLKYEQPNWVEQ